jgi:hypothetical protein
MNAESVMRRQTSTFLFSALSLFTLVQTGCDKVWGYYATGDPDNCVRTTNSCASDEFCNRETQACEKYLQTMYPREDVLVPPTSPPSFLSPGGSSAGLTYPRDIAYSIGAAIQSIPTATPIPTIYYTLDGSTPTPGDPMTLSGPSPISLGKLAGGTTLRWFADYGTPFTAEAMRTFAIGTDTTATTNAGFIMENTTLYGSNGPVVVVPRAARVNIKIGLQTWASSPAGSCPKCPTHVVVTVPTLGQVGCHTNIEQFGVYPGQTFQMFVSFTAPVTLGKFPVSAGIVQQARCDGITAAPANALEFALIVTQ